MKSSDLEFITIGRILTPWGIKGKLRVKVITDFPQRFAPSSTVYINRRPMTIDSTEWHKGEVIIKLNAIDSIEAARSYIRFAELKSKVAREATPNLLLAKKLRKVSIKALQEAMHIQYLIGC